MRFETSAKVGTSSPRNGFAVVAGVSKDGAAEIAPKPSLKTEPEKPDFAAPGPLFAL
jgi:hypothetical protein